jgi:arylsulfatase A-like enzyme
MPVRAALLALALALACAGPHSSTSVPADGRRPPNVVFFLVDDMGWMDSSLYGSAYYETPRLEELASRGLTFTDAYAASPLCSPTRAALLSGKAPHRLGFTLAWGHRKPLADHRPRYPRRGPPEQRLLAPLSRFSLGLEEVTLAEVLREAGYRTAHIGKWHLGRNPESWARAHGFDVALHGAPDHGPESYFSPYGFEAGTLADGPPGEYLTDRLTDEALRFIDANRDRPFLLHLWHYGVHGPWGHRPEITQRFAGRSDPRGEQGNPIMASMLKSIDDSLGRVLDRLDELGLADDTIVVFSSDNGGNVDSFRPDDPALANLAEDDPQHARLEEWRRLAGDRPPTSNAPLRAGKAWLYEGGTRVPLVVAGPGVARRGARTDVVTTSVDLYPTLLELAGLEPPEEQLLDGVSLAPVLAGADELSREAVFWHFPHPFLGRPPCSTVRRGPWKLVRWLDEHPDYPAPLELYDLEEDPGEEHDVAAEHPRVVRELTRRLDHHLEATGALSPIPNPAYTGTR